MYDYRCCVTGLNLRWSLRTALVLLEKKGRSYVPAACPVMGRYNHYGSITDIHMDVSASRLESWVESSLDSGELTIDPLVAPDNSELGRLECFFRALESANVDKPKGVMFKGRSLSFMLVDGEVMLSALRNTPLGEPEPTSFGESLSGAFPGSEVAPSIYGTVEPDDYIDRIALSYAVCKQVGITRWFESTRLKWSPPSKSGQFSTEESEKFLSKADDKFEDNDIILEGIYRYARLADIEE